MTDAIIDPVAFAELQENAGEDFVRELIDTFLEEAPPMLSMRPTRLIFSTPSASCSLLRSIRSPQSISMGADRWFVTRLPRKFLFLKQNKMLLRATSRTFF